MRICLFDGPNRTDLLPLVYTRSVSALFMGGMSLSSRWQRFTQATIVVETAAYLQEETPDFDIAVLAGCLPTPKLVDAILKLSEGQKLEYDNQLIAFRGAPSSISESIATFETIQFLDACTIIRYPWDLFTYNEQVILEDAAFFTHTHSESLDKSNQQLGHHPILVGKNVEALVSVFNTTNGPIIIDDNAIIMEGSLLRGPLYIGKNSMIKMGSKLYGGTSLGPSTKVGGELNNVVFLGNSNKGHDGFLGNAVVGEWCNLGAATDASNLKNDYGQTRAWNYTQQKFISTGLQFCGPIIGDHTKTAIHTTLNTATVIGIGCNVFSHGFPRTFIPSFTRGGAQGLSENRLDKVLETEAIMMVRRGEKLSSKTKRVLTHVFELTKSLRTS